jgi:hypothetical protein
MERIASESEGRGRAEPHGLILSSTTEAVRRPECQIAITYAIDVAARSVPSATELHVTPAM